MTVRVVDRGAKDLTRRLREAAGGMSVRVGVLGSEAEAQHQAGGLTTADVASFHEFGLGVPQRSWLREWVDEEEGGIRQRLRESAALVGERKSTARAELEMLGVWGVGAIQARMASGPSTWPELAEATVLRKTGRSGDRTARLIDTGQLRSSVSYDVVRGRSEVAT